MKVSPGRRALLLALAFSASACLSPPDAPDGSTPPSGLPDPGAWGPLSVDRLEYDLGTETVSDPATGRSYPVPVAGSVHVPLAAAGPFPVVVFLHGWHDTCKSPALEPVLNATGPFPQGILVSYACASASPVIETVDSYRGYDYIAEPLATHGYVVVSINANPINGQHLGDSGTLARAQLILRTLDELRRLNSTASSGALRDAAHARLDLSRVGLMGHSSGGESVVRALSLNAERPPDDRHAIRAVFALAPIDLYDQVAPDVAFATLLPYCDGDIWRLEGAQVYDRSRYASESTPSPKYQFLAMGSNHNYYNTVWWQDDAGGMRDPYCGQSAAAGGGRLEPADQRRHGLPLIAGFFRLHLGHEVALRDYFTGAAPLPATACPAGIAFCPDGVHVSYHAAAPDRVVVEDARGPNALDRNELGGSIRLEGFERAYACKPEGCPSPRNVAAAEQLAFEWRGPSQATFELPEPTGDLHGFDVLSLRVGVNFNRTHNMPEQGQDFRIVLEDASGRAASETASDHGWALYLPPGESENPGAVPNLFTRDQNAKVVLNMVRVPLADYEGVDLAHVRFIRLVFDATPSGSLQVTDLLVQR